MTEEVGTHAILERFETVEARLSTVEGAAGEPEAWHEVGTPGEPAFENGADTFQAYQPPAFRLNGDRVEFRGVYSGQGVVAFTLPEGYRPPADTILPVATGIGTGGDYGYLEVGADGAVSASSSSNGIGIEGCSFAVA